MRRSFLIGRGGACMVEGIAGAKVRAQDGKVGDGRGAMQDPY